MTAFLRRLLSALCLLAPLPALAQQPAPVSGPPHLAWRTGAEARAIERRIDALLARMTMAEKIGQLNLRGRGDDFRPDWIESGRTGAVMNFTSPAEVRAVRDRVAPLDDPRSIGEALKGGEWGDFWKYRVGDWRIIAGLDDGVLLITVIRIGNRREVYRR